MIDIEDRIYKYCSLKTAELIMNNNEVLLNGPNSFNDPYDTNILCDIKDLRKTKDILINYSLDLKLKEITKEKYRNSKWWGKIIFLPAKWAIKLQEINNKKSKEYRPILNYSRILQIFSNMGMKNGPDNSESQKSLNELIKIRDSDYIEKIILDAIKKTTKELLITCFSKTSESMLMWSHYSDNSRGVCLEFEKENFLDVVYLEKRNKFLISKLIYKMLWSYYENQTEQKTAEEITDSITEMTPFLTKSSVWKYEQEVRAIFNKRNPNIIKKDDRYYYKMKHLTSITLGYRVTEDERNRYVEFTKNKKIKLYQMELSRETFDLIRKEIDIIE